MYPTSILLALAAAALINAIVIPRDPTYNTCLDQYATIFAGQPTPAIADCTGCAALAVTAGFVAYGGNTENVQLAKDTYEENMAACRGPTHDATYDTCLEQYGTIFAGQPTPEIAACTGCAAQAVAAGFLAYGGNTENVQLAKDTYNEEMEECRAAR